MWVTDDRWVILGTVFRVVSEDEEAAVRVADALAGFDRTSRPARAAHIVQITRSEEGSLTAHNDCRRFKSSDGDWDGLLTSIVAVINNATIARLETFAVHSSVVEAGERVIAFPATTGGGKTTLAGALVKTGLGYLSDEALVLDADGSVIAYQKPLALSPWSADVLDLDHGEGERLAMPADLGGRMGDGGKPLTDLVLFERGHEKPDLQRLPASEGIAALLEYSFNHYRDPEGAFRLVTETARRINVWKLEYDDPLEAAALIASELAGIDQTTDA